MTWSVHITSGPCESFRERAALACTTAAQNGAWSDAYRTASVAAAGAAAALIADHLPGQHDTAYSASLSGHNGHGSAAITVSVSASPVPK